MKRNRNTVNMHEIFFDKDLIFEEDERLTRRWKRRYVTGKTFKNHCPNTGVKRTLNNHQKREVSVDPDYAFYLNVRMGCANDDDDVDDNDNDNANDDDNDDDDDANANDDDDNDPDYVMFLNHLREYGNSYALEIAVNDGMSMLVKYEEDGEFDDDNRKSLKKVKDVPREDEAQTKRVLRNISCHKMKGSLKTLNSVPSKGRKISMTEEDAKVECRANGSAMQNPCPKVPYSSMPETRHDIGSVMEDGSYEIFLNCLKLDADTLVLITEDGKKIRYEDEDENTSDSDSVIVVTDDVPRCDEGIHSPFVPSKVYCLDSKESSIGTSSKFREKLMDILMKPFDKKEYDELWKEASDRKPLERHIELRSGVTKRCPILESVGKSYLDHYTDLKNEIDSVRPSHYMVLNLLRGFFYWLKNLSQEGSFRPWEDESCLKLIRQL